MAQRLEQSQAAVQTQQLSSMQVAVAKLVELPVTELVTRVRDEMVDNAALEEKDPDNFDVDKATEADDAQRDDDLEAGEGDEAGVRDEENSFEEQADYGSEADAMGDYFSADDVPSYLQQRADAERDKNEFQYAGTVSFYDELQSQISEHNLTEREAELMEYIIGSLDEDGFLRKDLDAMVDELVIYHNIETTHAELERLLGILQQFEPRGIGARSLQECLHIQLTDPDPLYYTHLTLQTNSLV
uniref:RNA polymerase factor sigma-54 n=1 Tax=Alloprevotella sp. TaxID=1872471 RepID=UPI0040258201